MSKYFKEIDYGFMYGQTPKGVAEITRHHSDEKHGTYIKIKTEVAELTIRVTSAGKIEPFSALKKKREKFDTEASDGS